MSLLSENEQQRYDRQIILEQIGLHGQERLKASRVAIIGLGGLGSIVATYLAAAGIGYLRIVDCDKVDLTNLNRQILHWQKDVEQRKTISAFEKTTALNPEIKIEAFDTKFDDSNCSDIIGGNDLVIDCLDNFETRFLLNKACIETNIPFIHGACMGFEGRVSLFIPHVTPCLACVYPAAPPKEKFPIFGATAGMIGLFQVMEAIKFLLNKGVALKSRLLFYDALALDFRIFDLQKADDCAVCGVRKKDMESFE
jgi:adenylyltransferase/sulfurtransferase